MQISATLQKPGMFRGGSAAHVWHSRAAFPTFGTKGAFEMPLNHVAGARLNLVMMGKMAYMHGIEFRPVGLAQRFENQVH